MAPVREGPADEVTGWLGDQPHPETLAVTVKGEGAVWAREFPTARGLVSRAQS